jgi:hypothetical protein
MKHPGHTYGGFVPSISERGMTTDLNEIHSDTLLDQIWRKSNSNRIKFDLHLNKSMKNEKLHYSIGPHCSRWPQWLTGPKPNPNSPNLRLWPAHAVGCMPSARPVRGHRAVRGQRAWHSLAFRWLISDEVLTYAFYN